MIFRRRAAFSQDSAATRAYVFRLRSSRFVFERKVSETLFAIVLARGKFPRCAENAATPIRSRERLDGYDTVAMYTSRSSIRFRASFSLTFDFSRNSPRFFANSQRPGSPASMRPIAGSRPAKCFPSARKKFHRLAGKIFSKRLKCRCEEAATGLPCTIGHARCLSKPPAGRPVDAKVQESHLILAGRECTKRQR